jgi:predicted MFS family arabinose efflux permease
LSASPRLVAALVVSAFTYSASQMAVAPVIAQIQQRYDAPPEAAAWALTAFSLTSAIVTVVAGRVGDGLGHRRVMLISLAIFAVGAAVCAAAPALGILLAGRAIMGCGGAIFPLAVTLAIVQTPVDSRARAIAVVAGVLGVGSAAGAPLGGALTQAFGLPSVFIASGVMAGISLLLVRLWVPRSPSRGDGSLDLLGLVVYGGGVSCVLVAVGGWPVWGAMSPPIIGLLACGLVLLGLLVAVERRVRRPMLDMSVLLRRDVALANATTLLVSAGVAGILVLIPLIAQTPTALGGVGLAAAAAGALLVPHCLAQLVSSAVAGRSAGRMRPRAQIVAGSAVTAAGLAGLAFADGSPWVVAALGTAVGLGCGFAFAAVPILFARAVSHDRIGSANAVTSINRTIGAGLGTQLAIAIFIAAQPLSEGHVVQLSTTVPPYLGLASLCLAAMLCGLFLSGPAPRTRTAG